jgi:hypothetical protein
MMKGDIGKQIVSETEKAMAAYRAFEGFTLSQVPVSLAKLGEKLANYSKENGPWTDRTGNLRHSISYEFLNPTTLVFFAGMEYAGYVEFTPGYWVLSGAVEALKDEITRILVEDLGLKRSEFRFRIAKAFE